MTEPGWQPVEKQERIKHQKVWAATENGHVYSAVWQRMDVQERDLPDEHATWGWCYDEHMQQKIMSFYTSSRVPIESRVTHIMQRQPKPKHPKYSFKESLNLDSLSYDLQHALNSILNKYEKVPGSPNLVTAERFISDLALAVGQE